MDLLSTDTMLTMASTVSRLKMYPYFDAAHYTFMCLAVREDLATGAQLFSRKHPVSCWLSSMLMCFAGGILANLILGEPIADAVRKHDDLLLATAMWYLVFYAPHDVFYKCVKYKPVKIALAVLKETQRAYKVHAGVMHAAHAYPASYALIVLVGTIKGAGSGIMHTFEQLVRGVWCPQGHEMLRPTFQTKACALAALLFTMEKYDIIITGPRELVYMVVVSFFIWFKLAHVLLDVHEPFAPFENFFCAVFMGGLSDALSRAIVAARERRHAMQHPSEHQHQHSNGEIKKDL